MEGYIDQRYKCDLDQSFISASVPDEVGEDTIEEEDMIIEPDTFKAECNIDGDCVDIENSICTDERKCKCLEGFLSVYDDEQPKKV